MRHQTLVYPFDWVWWNYMSGSKLDSLTVSCSSYQGITSYIHGLLLLWATAELQLQKECTMLQLPHFSTSHSFSILCFCTLHILPDFKILLFYLTPVFFAYSLLICNFINTLFYISFLPTPIFLFVLYFFLQLRILLVCLYAYSHFLHFLLLLCSSYDVIT